MPYINKDDRFGAKIKPLNPGELNFAITSILLNYMEDMGGVSYHTINDIMGALEGAKAEFYRRKVVPYEIRKEQENGDVY